MSRIELTYCKISTSYLVGLFDIFIFLHVWQNFLCCANFLAMRTLCDTYDKEFESHLAFSPGHNWTISSGSETTTFEHLVRRRRVKVTALPYIEVWVCVFAAANFLVKGTEISRFQSRITSQFRTRFSLLAYLPGYCSSQAIFIISSSLLYNWP